MTLLLVRSPHPSLHYEACWLVGPPAHPTITHPEARVGRAPTRWWLLYCILACLRRPVIELSHHVYRSRFLPVPVSVLYHYTPGIGIIESKSLIPYMYLFQLLGTWLSLCSSLDTSSTQIAFHIGTTVYVEHRSLVIVYIAT